MSPTYRAIFTAGIIMSSIPSSFGADTRQDSVASRARQFVEEHEATVRPLEKAVSLAWWSANITGNDADFKTKEEAQNRLDAALADPARFARLRDVREAARAAKDLDPILRREIEVLYLQYLEKQVDPALLQGMTARANAVEKAFNVYRARVEGKELSDSEVRKVLKESKSSDLRRKVWESSKGVGAVVEADLKALVLLRNEAARKLGFKDYHAMMLELNEQRQDQVLKLFDELDQLTRGPFRRLKAEIDVKLAADFGLAPSELRPWHYPDPFFQESPAIYAIDLDAPYAHADILGLAKRFYSGIGLGVDDVLARSDLYEKSGKSPHAFCTDIDREGDVRVLANIVPNERWMSTLLHELGHAVYSSKNIPRSLPYALRAEAHILTTEGIAMLFERFSMSGGWLEKNGVRVDDVRAFDDAGSKMRRNRLLIFAAWCQVMLRFEKGMYEGSFAGPEQAVVGPGGEIPAHPAARTGATPPTTRARSTSSAPPAYYHNYLMGQLFASQVHETLSRDVLHADPAAALYDGRPEVGKYLQEKVFAPGRSLPWNELTRFATGAELNAKAFAAELKN
jgi:peptidyl-dipeptidase A